MSICIIVWMMLKTAEEISKAWRQARGSSAEFQIYISVN